MTMNLSYEAAKACMLSIAQYTSADLDSLGITPKDYAVAHGDRPWNRDDRRRVLQTLDALLFGTLDIMGLNRISVPAEYVAAVLSTFVAPCNRMVACMWMAEQHKTGAKAADLAVYGMEGTTVDRASPTQLFALICLLSENDSSTAVRKQFMARMNSEAKKSVADAA